MNIQQQIETYINAFQDHLHKLQIETLFAQQESKVNISIGKWRLQ